MYIYMFHLVDRICYDLSAKTMGGASADGIAIMQICCFILVTVQKCDPPKLCTHADVDATVDLHFQIIAEHHMIYSMAKICVAPRKSSGGGSSSGSCVCGSSSAATSASTAPTAPAAADHSGSASSSSNGSSSSGAEAAAAAAAAAFFGGRFVTTTTRFHSRCCLLSPPTTPRRAPWGGPRQECKIGI